MASALQKGLSDASLGAGIGTAIAPGYGTAIGAGIGGILGFITGSDETPKAPSYADISLQKDNPELFARVKQNDAVIAQAKQMYDARRQGPSATEMQQYNDYMAQVAKNNLGGGIAGTSAGYGLAGDESRKFQSGINDRIYNESMALQKNYADAVRAGYDMTRGGLQDVMQAQGHQFDFNKDLAGASNQMYSGIFNGGANLAGQAYNAYKNSQTPLYNPYGPPGPPPKPPGPPPKPPGPPPKPPGSGDYTYGVPSNAIPYAGPDSGSGGVS